MGVPVERIKKLTEGSPNVVERIEAGEVDLVINTPTGSGARADGYEIRRAAVARGIPCITTMSGASAAQRAIRAGGRRARGRSRSRSCTPRSPRRPRPPTSKVAEQPAEPRARSRRPSAAWPRCAPCERLGALRPDHRPRPRRARRPAAGPVLHARRGRAVGRGQRASAPTCRAPSRSPARGATRAAARSWTSCSRTSGPGTAPPRRAGARARRWRCSGRSGAASSRPPTGARPLLVGGGIGAAPLLCLARRAARGGSDPALVLGFRSAAHAARPPTCSPASRGDPTDDGSAGRHGLVTEPLREELDADPRRDRLRLRPAGDARGGAGAVRRARGAGPAGAGVGHGLRLRRLLRLRGRRPSTATSACASTGRCSTGARLAGVGHR